VHPGRPFRFATNKAAGEVPAAKQVPHRPGPALALGLRAGNDDIFIVPQTTSDKERFTMWVTSQLRNKTPLVRPTRRPRSRARCRPRLELLEDRTLPSTFLVSNVADNGAGSLRQAILDANAHAGADVIDFAIGSGVQTIPVGSTTGTPLPTITDSRRRSRKIRPGRPHLQRKHAPAHAGLSPRQERSDKSRTLRGYTLYRPGWTGDLLR
jgi:hypothetical protein